MKADRLLAASAVVGTAAFVVYTRTLLPGVDLGDTGGFQAAVLWPFTSARQAYPLYYALATPFVSAVSAAAPARGLNLFSAVWAGVAVALLTWVTGRICASVAAGVAAGLLLAFSYTFWTQAIIAEVYSLHLAIVGLCMVALLAYAARPSTARLVVFFAVYAAGFGNHLSMILLLLPCALFLIQVHPAPRQLFAPVPIALAIAIAALGALQYAGNFMAVAGSMEAPQGWVQQLSAFWFDTTKADWRASMVFGVGAGDASNRLAMWSWDAQQQFGAVGLILAALGLARLWSVARPWAVFLAVAYAVNAVFALTYNVGDTHVFFLPGHYFTACLAGAALALPATRRAEREAGGEMPPWMSPLLARARPLLVAAAFGYAAWRGWDTWPATDRHTDQRGEELVARLAFGLEPSRTALVSGLNWETENALLYSARWERPEIVWTRAADVMGRLPFFVADNHAIGRDVVLTAEAAVAVAQAYGPLFPLVRDDTPPPMPISLAATRVPRGAPYVLTVLTPQRDHPLDVASLDLALATLTGNRPPPPMAARYVMVAGVAGERPAFLYAADTPFRESFAIAGEQFHVRMDAWLPFDTFRRGSFGHVLHGRSRVLFVERGVSLGWLDSSGVARAAYAAGPYEAQPRFRIPAATASPDFADAGARPSSPRATSAAVRKPAMVDSSHPAEG